MALTREAYQALKDIVGQGNISEEPAILDSYAFQYLAEIARPQQSKFMIRPEAALMPGSTEEVQAIVKTCNRYRIKIKPYSTGWYFFGAPQSKGVIQLDLRRMDRILEIDDKNMFAVIEPYVICAQLQAEAMKVGLNCNIIGAGASCSILASATSYSGSGPNVIYMGFNSDNMLGVEWVMPNGDILRTGSLGSGAGWFCGEGPGPSLRGLIRGGIGARGGMGVFTKVAIKLSSWPGPPVLPVEGTVPAYHSPLPENFRAYTLAFPDWQAYAEAYYRIWDAEIGYIAHRQFNMLGNKLSSAFWMLYNDPTKQLDDIVEFAQRPEIQRLTKETELSFEIVLAGHYPGDIEYQEKVLDQILSDLGGHRVTWAGNEELMQRFTFLYLHRLGHKNLNYVFGTFLMSGVQEGTPDHMIKYPIPVAIETLARHQEKRTLVDCGANSLMGPIFGLCCGGPGVLGQFSFYDPHDKESVKGEIAYMQDAVRSAVERGISPGREIGYLQMSMTDEELEAAFAKAPQPDVFRWQWKIKQILDPQAIGDRLYPTLEPK
jgi:glycolate oxidase